MRRILALAWLVSLLAPAGARSAEPPAASAADHVLAMVGTWTCHTIHGSLTRQVGARVGGVLEVANDVQQANGVKYTLVDRYTFDESAGVWRVALGAGSEIAIDGTAPPWNTATWDVSGRGPRGVTEHVRYELLADGDLRRSISFESPDGSGTFVLASAERCTPGEQPPPADACIVTDAPAQLVELARIDLRSLPPETAHGPVEILVQLDERSQITSTSVVQSPSPYLISRVVQALRLSKFQTALDDCRPFASSFRFGMNFGRR
jgi:hypothetical protein